MTLRWYPLVAGSSLVLEALAWRYWLAGATPPGLFLHLTASAVLLIPAPGVAWAWRRWAAIGALSVPGGGSLIALLAQPRPEQSAEAILEEIREHTRPPAQASARAPVRVVEQLERALTTESTLRASNQEDARAARSLADSVSAVSDAVEVRRLLSLLKDPALDAYHIAAAKISHLQEYFAVTIYQANQKVADDPESLAAQIGLAEAYLQYLRSGLLEGPLAHFYYQLAVQRFETVARLEPDNPLWPLRVAELHRRNGAYRQALETCESLLARWPDHQETRMRILEIYYYGARLGVAEAVKQFEQMLSRLRHEVDAEKIDDPWLRRAAHWWFSADA